MSNLIRVDFQTKTVLEVITVEVSLMNPMTHTPVDPTSIQFIAIFDDMVQEAEVIDFVRKNKACK